MNINPDVIDENKGQVAKIIDTLNSGNITVENYHKFIDKIISTNEIILAQIENVEKEFGRVSTEFDEVKESESFKSNFNNGSVQTAPFKMLYRMNVLTRDAYSWKLLGEQLATIGFTKLSELVKDVNAMQVKRDVLKEFREMDKEQRSFFTELFTNKVNMLDQQFISVLKIMQDENNAMLRQVAGSFELLIKEITSKKEHINSINNITTSLEHKQLKPTLKKDIVVEEKSEELIEEEKEDEFGFGDK